MHKRLTWHLTQIEATEKFFALIPIGQDGRLIWLRTAYRTKVYDSVDGVTYYEYRLPGEGLGLSDEHEDEAI